MCTPLYSYNILSHGHFILMGIWIADRQTDRQRKLYILFLLQTTLFHTFVLSSSELIRFPIFRLSDHLVGAPQGPSPKQPLPFRCSGSLPEDLAHSSSDRLSTTHPKEHTSCALNSTPPEEVREAAQSSTSLSSLFPPYTHAKDGRKEASRRIGSSGQSAACRQPSAHSHRVDTSLHPTWSQCSSQSQCFCLNTFYILDGGN